MTASSSPPSPTDSEPRHCYGLAVIGLAVIGLAAIGLAVIDRSILRQQEIGGSALRQHKLGIRQIILRDPVKSRLLVKPVRDPA